MFGILNLSKKSFNLKWLEERKRKKIKTKNKKKNKALKVFLHFSVDLLALKNSVVIRVL